MIPVFFGSTLLVFYILQSVPDGPFEQAVKQIKMAQMASGEGGAATGGGENNSMEISEDVLEKLRRQYGLDKPIWKRYLIWLGLAEKEIELNFTQTACIVVTLSILTMVFRLAQIDFSIQDYFVDLIEAWLVAWFIGGFIFIYAGMCLFIRRREENTKLTVTQLSSLVCCGVLIGWIAAIWMVEAIALEMSFFELWPESFRHNPRYASLLLVPMWWAWMERSPEENVIQPESNKSTLFVGAILLMLVFNSYHLATTGTRGMEVIGEELSDEMEDDWEGCLSLPGMSGLVRRYKKIKYSGLDLNGKNISDEVEGLHARVIQHEFDHLNGVLYTSRLADKRAFGFSEEIEKFWKKNDENIPK